MDMYQKREMRKNKKMNEDTKSLPSTIINWYPGHMAKTKRQISEMLDLIDVIYEVVDARMPYSSKIKDIDSFTKNKPRILIMTKSDLCDLNETNKWKKYYEDNGYKVILLNLEGNANLKPLFSLTDEVMKDINEKRLAKGQKIRKCRVLIVGIPNVGKSTLINRLVNKKVVVTGNKPGVTKTLSWIRINDKIELLDSPGILWPKLDDYDASYNLASLTAIKEEILPIDKVVIHILKKLNDYYPNILKERYKIDKVDFDEITNTLDEIGKKRGCLIKGGEIDYDKVYSIILNDIKNGVIKGITFDRYE